MSLPAPPGGSWGGIVSSPPESPAHGHLLRLGGVSLPFVPAPPPHHPLLLSCRQSSPYSTGHYSISRAFSSSHLQSPPCRVGDLRRSQTACGRLRGAVLQLPQTVGNCLQGLFSIKASAPPAPHLTGSLGGFFFPYKSGLVPRSSELGNSAEMPHVLQWEFVQNRMVCDCWEFTALLLSDVRSRDGDGGRGTFSQLSPLGHLVKSRASEEFPLWCNRIHGVSAAVGMWVRSQVWCSRLRNQHCCSCGRGHDSGLDLIPGLEPICHGAAKKKVELPRGPRQKLGSVAWIWPPDGWFGLHRNGL